MSPALNAFGWRGIYSLFAALLFIPFVVYRESIFLKKWFLLGVFAVVLTSIVPAFYWQDLRYVAFPVFLLTSLYVIQYVDRDSLEKLISLVSAFMLLLLLMAVFGFILAIYGVEPVLSFNNPDGRPNFLYFTTLTNSFRGDMIRPSGIYDEPGALSLYVCAVAAIRHLSDRDNRLTWVILLLGFVTLSLAHLIYVFVHLLSERFNKKNSLRFLLLGGVVLVVLLASNMHMLINDVLFSRLSFDEAGAIAGDNRSFRMLNAIYIIKSDPMVVFFGVHPSCVFDYNVCKEMFPLMGENPLSPVAFQGMFLAWPYYVALLLLLFAAFKGKKNLVCLGFALLLLQRPGVASISMSMVVVLVSLVAVRSIRGKSAGDSA